MKTVPNEDGACDEVARRLERAIDQALELRKTIMGLPDPHLRVFVDAALLELGRHLTKLNETPPQLPVKLVE